MVGMGRNQRRGWQKLMEYSAATRRLLKKVQARVQRKAGKKEASKHDE